jgi:hypothetical protein
MATLLQCIKSLIDNITITNRQEDNIDKSVSNINTHLLKEESNLNVKKIFLNGSYERDTIIRPLNDIDLFAVLKKEDWQDENCNYPNPQSVLTKFKNHLNGLNDYKDKVSQDRPCVTIHLSDKDFDILPSFETGTQTYLIPNYELTGWTTTNPEILSSNLNSAHKNYNYNLKQIVRVVKYWNRDFNYKTIPSYHIEEISISISNLIQFENFEQGIRKWFEYAETFIKSDKFKSFDEFEKSQKRLKKVKDKLIDAKKLIDDKKEGEAIQIWKEIFGKEFLTVDIEEAKSFSKNISEGNLKISSSGALSETIGKNITKSSGYFGEFH